MRQIIEWISAFLHRTFPARTGPTGWLLIGACAALSVIVFFLLQQLRPRGRRLLIAAVTFLAGLYYALEYFLPYRIVNGQENNALTPLLPVASDINQTIT